MQIESFKEGRKERGKREEKGRGEEAGKSERERGKRWEEKREGRVVYKARELRATGKFATILKKM